MKRFISLAFLLTVAANAFARPLEIPVVYYRLPNGLKVVISETHVAPTATVAVYYNVGFRIEPKGRTGFAHLFEHMMFQGSSHVKKFEHAKIVEANGGNLNGSTNFDYTNYFESLPSNAVETALWLEADRMRSLDITPENLKNQQNVVSEEVRGNVLNQPYGLFEWLSIWQNANQNWSNAHNFYGDLHELEAATVDDVKQFFRTYYAPNNAVVTVVGDVDPNAVKAMIEKYFSDIPLQSVPEHADVSEPKQTAEKQVKESDKLATVPALAFAYHLPDQESPDYAPMVLLDLVLQGDESSRLYQRLVKEKAISTDWNGGIDFEFGGAWDYSGPMLVTSRTLYKPAHTSTEILKEVDTVIHDVQEHGVPKKELDAARVRYRSQFYDSLESTFGRAHLLSALALFRDDPQRINALPNALDGVTSEQIQAVARKYYVPSNRTVVDRVPEVTK
jgi:predicted Zn-dependent peptidase